MNAERRTASHYLYSLDTSSEALLVWCLLLPHKRASIPPRTRLRMLVQYLLAVSWAVRTDNVVHNIPLLTMLYTVYVCIGCPEPYIYSV